VQESRPWSHESLLKVVVISFHLFLCINRSIGTWKLWRFGIFILARWSWEHFYICAYATLAC
jgi:hypothetical protein